MTTDLDDSTMHDSTMHDSTMHDSPTAGHSKPVLIASAVQAVAAGLLIVLLFLEWVQGGHLGLSGNGGAGFGVLALATAITAIVAVVARLRGRPPWRLLGPSQLAFMLAIATFFSNLLFLWVFRTGGAPKWVYVVANLLIYAGVVGIFADRSERVQPLDEAQIRIMAALTVVLGVGVVAAPMLGYTRLGGRTLTGYEPGAPRVGVLLLLVGGVTVFYGVQRFRRAASLTDLGPYVLWCHVTIGLGVLATAPAFAWVLSGLWGNNFSVGVGAYVSVALGAGLIGLGVAEAMRRRAPGL